MDDTDTLDVLDGLQRTGIRPGLSRIRRLVARLGHPERQFPSVLITGTNGKGSTAAFLEAILREAGYRTGRFTSPHLVDVRERIAIDGGIIDATTFLALGREVRDAMAGGRTQVRATFFEALTAIGFLAFARAQVDIAVVEVGMGGRFDSTNVCDPLVSILTNVTLDHVSFLGSTVEAIAAEKVGVARPGRVLVTAVEDGLYLRVVGPALAKLGATSLRADRDFHSRRRPDGRLDFAQESRQLDGIVLGLAGAFQCENAALAVAAALALSDTGLAVADEAIRAGLGATVWPGRMQTLRERPRVLLDGCHNPGAALRLAQTLLADPPARPLVMVYGSRPDKDARSVLGLLAPLCDAIITTRIPGLADPTEAATMSREIVGDGRFVEVRKDLHEAIATALALAGAEGTVLVTGSLYLVGAVLASKPW